MQATIEQENERYLRTGDRDILDAAWPGNGLFEQATKVNTALQYALTSAVRIRTRQAATSDGFDNSNLVAQTGKKVEPCLSSTLSVSSDSEHGRKEGMRDVN